MADELRAALELATEEELSELTEILFRRKFNPIDYLYTPDPMDVQSQGRQAWLDALEQRFRFLAADGMTVLQGQADRVTYRQCLIQICRYLRISYSEELSTTDLEAEVFLNLLSRAWKQLSTKEKGALTLRVQQSLARSEIREQLPLAVQQDPMGLLVKGGSALAISSIVRPMLLQLIARQFAYHVATYQVAKQAIAQGGAVAASQFQSYVALQTAKRGMALSATRYGVTRSVLAFVGPAMWGLFFADLGWRAIATNYGRVIPTVFALAQIRLTRADCLEAAWEPV
jgi:uncharacterized protein YaaW (UPF0174 family)